MTLKLYKPSGPKQTSWRIRGSFMGRLIEQSARTKDRDEAEKVRLNLQEKISAGDGLIWSPIPGFSRYEISDDGQVRRIAGLLKPTRSQSGHLKVTLYSDRGKPWRAGIHQIVARTFLGNPPQGKPYACHKNGIADQNTKENLYWGSAADNAADAVRHASLVRATVVATAPAVMARRKKAFRRNWLRENEKDRASPW